MSAKWLSVTVLWILSSGQFAGAAEKAAPDAVARRIGGLRGICVVLGDEQCTLALVLVRHTRLTVFVQVESAQALRSACRAADAAGVYGTRLFVGRGPFSRIALADNVADALVATGRASGVAEAEALRVLRPAGTALLGEKLITKPQPEGTDDWSHHYHGPDNNPQSADRLARAPYLTQFVAVPRYAPAPQAVVASGGRVFAAFGHVAWHHREEPWLDTLIAINGFNGTILWRRKLPSGIMVDRSTMIATPTTLYLADGKSCKLIAADSGKELGEIAIPAELAGGTFWKWMALADGVLYALVGKAEPPDPVRRWGRQVHGWPWGEISRGYNRQRYQWGFGETLLAVELKTKKVLWHRREDKPIDSRSLCMKKGRIYLCRFGEYLACLDAADGKELWRRTAGNDAALFEAIGPYRPGHGYIGGWKSTVYLKCTDDALYFVGPQVQHLTAVDAAEGKLLWTDARKDLHVVIREDALYTVASQAGRGECRKLDLLTGKVLKRYRLKRRACTRSTGTADGILFRANGGSVRLDLPSGKTQWISPMRPSCHVGVVIAGGHLYWMPWACDCNLQMFGVISCGPAGEFKFGAEATEAERLEKGAAVPSGGFKVSAGDWPTYRADNARTAATRVELPAKVRELWEFRPDGRCEPTAPVAAGGLVFLAGSDGIVRALGAADGKQRWKAYTGGAVRYPPAIAGGRALVGSGDGWVYALDATTGKTLWRFRAAPVARKVPVYGSLLSTWPVAGGVLVDRGVAYFAAGMNNFDGTHVYALDAATGEIKWQNNRSGHLDAFGHRGVGVQGELLLSGGRLYLAGGNAVSPGIYNVADGKCLNSPPPPGSRAPRGRELHLSKGRVSVRGQPLYSTRSAPVYDRSVRWGEAVVRAGKATLSCKRVGAQWKLQAAGDDAALWEQLLPGEPVRWGLAVDASGRVIVVLRDGRVLCFGADAKED